MPPRTCIRWKFAKVAGVKKGTFKGSFKVYALKGAGKARKLKKYTVNVSGVVVDGVGYGTATCKKPAVAWPVTVR